MKYVLTLFFCLSCLVCQAQPPAGTFKSKTYGGRTTYTSKYGKVLGSSKTYGRQTNYYDGKGRILSREYKTPRGSTYIQSY